MAKQTSTIPPSQTSTPNSSLLLPPTTSGGGNKADEYPGKQKEQLAAWVRSEYQKAKTARQVAQRQWQVNMRFVRGNQWIQEGVGRYRDKLTVPMRNSKTPPRKTINRVRQQFRAELARFMQSSPNIVGVPATSEGQDVRSANAAEAVWEYIQYAGNFPFYISDAYIWMIQTGNGFIKTWWDDDSFDETSQQQGCIRFASIKPFEFFVPDLREREVENQPFITIATIRPLEWCQRMFGNELGDQQLIPSVASSTQIIEEGSLQTGAVQRPDSCIIYETWVKPGTTALLPQGGVIVTIDNVIVRVYPDGVPYPGGKYPVTKIENIPSGTFYADSSLTDTITLQREYNTVRSDLAHSGHVYGQPHVLAQKGSIVSAKIQNVAAQVVEYEPGTPPPQAMPMPEVPTYYVNQLEQILQDWTDISGQQDVSQGQAPPGVTAGTAINFLQERVDGFFTPEVSSIEWGLQDIARKGIALFQQYVDIPRAIKVIGADKSFDIQELKGADIVKGTDVRVEVGSGQVHSQAADDAKTMDLWVNRVITDPTEVLQMMRIGGPKNYLDVFDAASAKAERENTRMKELTPVVIQQWQMRGQLQEMAFQAQQALTPALPPADAQQDPNAPQGDPSQMSDPQMSAQQPGDPAAVDTSNPMTPPGPPPLGPIIPVDDFDVHEKHIVVHNTFRMTQEYDLLPDEIKQQFALHVQAHKNMLMRAAIQQFTQSIPSDGTDPSAPKPPDMSVDTGVSGGDAANVSGNGVIPHADSSQGDQSGSV